MKFISEAITKKTERVDSALLRKWILELFKLVKEEIDGAADPEAAFQNEI